MLTTGARRRRAAQGNGQAALRREIRRLGPWFHNLHLPDGTQTAPAHFLDFPRQKWDQVRDHLPADLSGWKALDVGCNAGFYTFELARRGAAVVGIDSDPRYLAQARWAAERYGLTDRIELRQQQVYQLAGERERFDLVLFMGVFYHLRYPLLGLDIVAQRTDRLMLFQSLSMRGDEVVEDTAGLALLRSAGLRVIGRPGDEMYLCAPDPRRPSPVTTWDAPEYQAATGHAPLARRSKRSS